MPDSMNKTMKVPADVALTEWSRKFYDGTYSWDSEGFTDDDGVYRVFDCYDPAARAPTPFPPMLLGDLEYETTDKATVTHAEGSHLTQRIVTTTNERRLPSCDKSTTISANPHHETVIDDSGHHQPGAIPKIFTFASNASSKSGRVTVRQDELFQGFTDRDRLISKMDGILVACRHTGTELSLEEGYRLCGFPTPPRRVERARDREISPTGSPEKEKTEAAKSDRQTADQATMRASNMSTNDVTVAEQPIEHQLPNQSGEGSTQYSDFSDCPSDLSDWEVEGQVESGKVAPPKAGTVRDTQNLSDGKAKRTRNTTRGIARKIRKGGKTLTANDTAPALLSLQSGSFMRASSSSTTLRRRSTRQGNAQGGK